MTENPDGTGTHDGANRRRFLKAMGALGAVGLAGCGGDGDDTTATETTKEPRPTSPAPGTTTEPETTTEPGGTDTLEPQPLEDDPAALLEIEGGSLQAGESTTLEGTLTNPYLFAVRNVEVSAEAPGDDWTVSATGDTSFETIESQGSQGVGWEVTAPEEADGEFTLTATVSYETNTDSASIPVDVPLVIFTPGEAPQEGLEAYFPLDSDPPVNQLTGNEATVVGEASAGASGVIGDAWEFTADGSAETVTDTVISEPLPINGEEATVGAWMYADEVTEEYSRAFHVDEGGEPAGDPGPTNGWNIEFGGTSPELAPQYWNGGGTGVDSGSAVPAPPGEWLFVVMVVEGDDCRYHTFSTDGELDGSPQEGTGTRGQSEEASVILMTGDGRETPGRMDEVRAYSRALSGDEVEALYLASGGTGV
jgi:hypothetical protein